MCLYVDKNGSRPLQDIIAYKELKPDFKSPYYGKEYVVGVNVADGPIVRLTHRDMFDRPYTIIEGGVLHFHTNVTRELLNDSHILVRIIIKPMDWVAYGQYGDVCATKCYISEMVAIQ